MKQFFIGTVFSIIVFSGLLAQDKPVLLTKNFKFKDGIFLSFEDFRTNSPSYSWEELEFSLFANPQTFITKVESIRKLDGTAIDLEKVWGLSIDGIPHIRLEKGALSDDLYVFVSMKVRGKLCYFSYQDAKTEMVTIKAYNPLTKKPFREGKVPREVDVVIEKMLNFQTGELMDFTVDNFIDAIEKDDKKLVNTIQDLSPEEARQKLFKCLLIYVDRNQVFINESVED